MSTEHYYEVGIRWSSDRKGVINSPELTEIIEVATPPQFPQGVPDIWSPEHLFTAAVSSCLMTTFLAIAENSKLEFSDFECKASGKLEKVDGKYQMTEIILSPVLTIAKEEDRERALRVIQKSEAGCLISNSIKSKITLQPQIK